MGKLLSMEVQIALVALMSLCLIRAAQAGVTDNMLLSYAMDREPTPTEARNIRAEARYHFSLANKAQNEMFRAELNDDVDGYEKWQETMRQEDPKWIAKVAEYDQIRDFFEAKIRRRELTIDGFEFRYDKGDLASIFDHLTGRART